MEQSRHQQGACKGLLCGLAHFSSNCSFLQIFNSGTHYIALFLLFFFHLVSHTSLQMLHGCFGARAPTSSIPLRGICCTASSCLLDFTDSNIKSRRAVSAVKWCPYEILTDNSEMQRTVLWRRVKCVWHKNRFTSSRTGTGALCTPGLHPLHCSSGECSCAGCRPKHPWIPQLYSSHLWSNYSDQKLTKMSLVCVLCYCYAMLLKNMQQVGFERAPLDCYY